MDNSYTGTLNQAEWETYWRWSGINKFVQAQQDLLDKGSAALSSPGAALIKKFLEPVETLVAKRVTDGFYTKAGKEKADTARPVEYYAIVNTNISVSAYLALEFIINRLMRKSKVAESALSLRGYSAIASGIGAIIEREAQAMLAFDDKAAVHKFFSNTFSNTPRGVQAKQEAFKKMIADYEWESWGTEKRARVGAVYLWAMEEMGLIEVNTFARKGKKVTSTVSLTQGVIDWIFSNVEHVSSFFSTNMPMIERPLDISTENNSCFYTDSVRRLSYCFTRDSKHNTANAPVVVDAINKAKNVPYELNEKVYFVAKSLLAEDRAPKIPSFPIEPEFPFDEATFDKTKLSPEEKDLFHSFSSAKAQYYAKRHEVESKRLAVSATMNVAREMYNQKYRIGADKFWYSYFLDFRGRLYPHTRALNIQGSDLDKGMVQFYNKKPLGSRGKYWLAVHGANLFGEDKISLDDRVEWAKNNTDMIRYIAQNPTNKEAVDIWGKADKPYQFLAFCFEWDRMHIEGDNFLSAIPVAIDGSCNGIQNYSAMLRDPVGAAATNLTDSELPSDIYKEVAEVLEHKLKIMNDDTGYARDWLSHGINRKLTKRQVMTLPYGSTIYSCSEYTKLYADENCSHIWTTPFDRVKAASWLTPLLWESIGEVVVKGREAMDWLQEVAKLVADTGNQVYYSTPLGLRVRFKYANVKRKPLKLRFNGETKQVTVGIRDQAKPNKAKASTSIAPNFIHSLDASHLALTIHYFDGEMLPVHDSYATHACDADELSFKTRKAFYDLYKDTDPLEDLRDSLQESFGIELPEAPKKGEFNLKEVLRATYFFA